MSESGMIVLRPTPAPDVATVIITGVGRSGTSMAAAVIDALGVPLGGGWQPGIYEDDQMRTAFYHFYHDMRASTIARYNDRHARWGFKFPSIHRHMHPPETGQFRNPRLVVMHRDAVSVACRARMDVSPVLAEQAAMAAFADKVTCPVLMPSYEKALRYPKAFTAALAAFCGVRAPDIDGAAARVGDAAAYLRAAHE